MHPLRKPLLAIAVGVIFVSGCGKEEAETPSAARQSETPKATATTQPLIPIAQVADWCPEHGVPESICARCNDSLAAGFKAKGDWDEKHNVPKSQCFECDPTLKVKFAAAYKEKYGKDAPGADKQDE